MTFELLGLPPDEYIRNIIREEFRILGDAMRPGGDYGLSGFDPDWETMSKSTDQSTGSVRGKSGSILHVFRQHDSRDVTGSAPVEASSTDNLEDLEAPLGPGETVAFQAMIQLADLDGENVGFVVSVPDGADGGFVILGPTAAGGFFMRGYGADKFNTSVGAVAGGMVAGESTALIFGIARNGSRPGRMGIKVGDAENLLTDATLAFIQHPSRTIINSPIQPPVTVGVYDTQGQLVYTDNSTSITIAKGGGAGILTGTLTQTVVNGVATFADLELDTVDDDYTLTADAAAFDPVTSSVFEVVGTGSGSFYARMIVNTPQVVATATDVIIDFGIDDLDEGGFRLNSTTLKIPVGLDGVYLVSAGFAWDVAAADATFYTRVFKNGASIYDAPSFAASGSGNVTNATFVDLLVAGDELKVIAHHFSGSNQNVTGGAIMITKL